MNIGMVSNLTGLNTKTIRYYEQIGLVLPSRAANGYRDYTEQELHRLRFIQRSRSLGFTIDECRNLLSLYDDRGRASADVKKIAFEKIAAIEHKIEELQSLRSTLKTLSDNCHGDSKPQCPIIDELAGV